MLGDGSTQEKLSAIDRYITVRQSATYSNIQATQFYIELDPKVYCHQRHGSANRTAPR